MAIDGFFTRALAQELRGQLKGGRVHKIYQPFEQELELVIRSNRVNHRLAASVHPQYFSIYLTEERSTNPKQAPMFCMLLRKYLESAFVVDIQQYQNDRIIDFTFTGRDELGFEKNILLTFELMGRHSNIILVNLEDQTIIDCIKHVSLSQNSYRSLSPGAEFKRPPKNENQSNIYELSDSQLVSFVHENAEALKAGQGFRCVQGMSKLSAQAVAYWMEADNMSPLAALERIKSAIEFPSPCLYQTDHSIDFYACKLPQLSGKMTAFDSLSSLIFIYYHRKVHLDRVKQLTGNILQKVQQVLEKNQKKIANLAKDRRVAEQADQYRIKGELLNAYAYQIEAGQEQVVLANYYDDNKEVEIKLNPRLTAHENAQAYFKKYQKYRDALKYIDRESRLASQEITYLDSILVQLENADLDDVEAIKEELIEQNYVSQKKATSKKRSQVKLKPRRFRSSDGVMIYVGRNNQQNDELSLRKAAKNHWWLHTKDIPGAHVIIESDKPSDQTMEEAAMIAAYYSKFAQSANVPVDTVQVKNLHKPKGAKPGFVIYQGQRTLYVTPNRELVEKLEFNN